MARRALVAGSPRPEAETVRTADPTPSFVEGEGNALIFQLFTKIKTIFEHNSLSSAS